MVSRLLLLRVFVTKEGFLVLSNNVQNINKINTGTCLHGLPPGACPVCSMSGGGTLRQSDRNRKVGEMTYHECAMIGNMMKARELAQKNHQKSLEIRALNLQNFEKAMVNHASRMAEFVNLYSKSFIAKPVVLVVQNIILPLVNFIQSIPKLFQTINNIKFEITDKLNALYGEAKAFLKKASENALNLLNSGLQFILKIFKKNDTENKDNKIDDDKRIFNLKTILHKIKRKLKNKKDKKHEHGTEN